MQPLPVEPEILLNSIGDLLKQTLGTSAQISHYTIRKQRHDYAVVLLTMQQPELELVVKVAGPKASISCPFERTAALHRLVAAKTSIDIPAVIAADSSYRSWPWRYLIRTAVAGEEWSSVRPKLNIEEVADAHYSNFSGV